MEIFLLMRWLFLDCHQCGPLFSRSYSSYGSLKLAFGGSGARDPKCGQVIERDSWVSGEWRCIVQTEMACRLSFMLP